MAKFAEYGFNKSHSAAYALIAYQTAYLKAHYPVEFMAALLSSEMGDADKILRHLSECREKKIEVLPPDVNESQQDFTVVGGKIRFGLAAVKNVGLAAIQSILAAREEKGDFTSLPDFCLKVDLRKVNKRVIESLIKCGAFDSISPAKGPTPGRTGRSHGVGAGIGTGTVQLADDHVRVSAAEPAGRTNPSFRAYPTGRKANG